jgi:UDP:flavonoid glycosyltransferase YjiC (YdhE family)
MRFAMICLAAQGRLLPMLAVARELLRRGHELTFYGPQVVRGHVDAAGVEFVDRERFAAGRSLEGCGRSSLLRRALPALLRRIGREKYADARGLRALALHSAFCRQSADRDLDCIPGALNDRPVDALLASDLSQAALTVAELANVPLVNLSTGVPRLGDATIPPEFMPWRYRDAGWARTRNRLGYHLRSVIELPLLDLLNGARARASLAPHRHLGDALPPSAVISQLPPGLDYPARDGAQAVHYVGPFESPADRAGGDFPWERLGEEPIVYVSTGTLSEAEAFFRRVAEACAPLPVQVVMTRGGGKAPADPASLPGSPIVVDYCPQLEVLARASVTVTHGSMNTIVESLACAVPVVAIPIMFDQPGCAARLAWTGAGLALSPRRARGARLRASIRAALEDVEFAQAAQRMQRACRDGGGVERACHLIETVAAGGSTTSHAGN